MRRIVLLIIVALLTLGSCASLGAYEGPAPPPGPGLPANIVGVGVDQPGHQFSAAGLCFQPLLYESPFDVCYFSADAVGFRRDGQPTQPMATLNTPTNTVLGTNDLPFVNEPGLHLMAGRRLNREFSVEVNFLGLLKWDETRALQNLTLNSQGTLGNLFSPLSDFGQPGQVGIDYNNLVSIRTTSDFNTAEVNLRQNLYTPPSLMQASGLYGFRYMNIHEQFQYRSRSASAAPAGTNNAVDLTTHNSLFGFQAGGTLEFRIEPRAWVNFVAKGILCQNNASQATQYTFGPAAGPTTTVESGAAKGRVALGVDVAGSLVWKFTPSIVGRVGYQGIIINGLALGSDNFSRNAAFIPTGVTDVYRTGNLVFHGPFTGVTVTW